MLTRTQPNPIGTRSSGSTSFLTPRYNRPPPTISMTAFGSPSENRKVTPLERPESPDRML